MSSTSSVAESALQHQCYSDETYSNPNHDGACKLYTPSLLCDPVGGRKYEQTVSEIALRAEDIMISASFPLTPDFQVHQQDPRWHDHEIVPFEMDDAMEAFPTPGIDGFDINYQLGQAALNPWCEALSLAPNDSLVYRPTEQSVNSTFSQYMSTLTASYSREEDSLNGDYTLPAYANPLIDGQTPEMIAASNPVSSNGSEDTSCVTEFNSKDFETDDQRWLAVQIRSRGADSAFLYGVFTTKIYCRPSCASRRASRKNVKFFPFPGAIEAAENANLRACKRCKPQLLGTVNTSVLGICQVLRTIIAETQQHRDAETKEILKLDSLALLAGLSAFHLLRLFKTTTQLTPGGFINACRSFALQDALGYVTASGPGTNVEATRLVNDSSCWSPRTARKALGGISPSEYANGAPSKDVHYCYGDTPCGRLCVVFSRDESAAETRVHAVLLGPDAGTKACLYFPKAKGAIAYQDQLNHSIRDIEKAAKDRDTELTADVLPTLWRARMWLKLMQQ